MPEAKELGPLERAMRKRLGMPIPEPSPSHTDKKKKPTEEEVKQKE